MKRRRFRHGGNLLLTESGRIPDRVETSGCNADRRRVSETLGLAVFRKSGGGRIRTCDLEVMSLASYRAAPPRVIGRGSIFGEDAVGNRCVPRFPQNVVVCCRSPVGCYRLEWFCEGVSQKGWLRAGFWVFQPTTFLPEQTKIPHSSGCGGRG